jgi:hypothetical protein
LLQPSTIDRELGIVSKPLLCEGTVQQPEGDLAITTDPSDKHYWLDTASKRSPYYDSSGGENYRTKDGKEAFIFDAPGAKQLTIKAMDE